MSPIRDDRCGARVRRAAGELTPPPPPDGQFGLTSLGAAFLDALRDDPRFRDIIADPFGEHGTGQA